MSTILCLFFMSHSGAFTGYGVVFGKGFGTIYSSVNGSATAAPENCTHDNDVGVFCVEESPSVCSSGAVRLAGSPNNNEGRVEMCVNSQWGTICDDSWSIPSTAVACNQLNKFGNIVTHVHIYALLVLHKYVHVCRNITIMMTVNAFMPAVAPFM